MAFGCLLGLFIITFFVFCNDLVTCLVVQWMEVDQFQRASWGQQWRSVSFFPSLGSAYHDFLLTKLETPPKLGWETRELGQFHQKVGPGWSCLRRAEGVTTVYRKELVECKVATTEKAWMTGIPKRGFPYPAGWFSSWKILSINGWFVGTTIFGNHHIYIL